MAEPNVSPAVLPQVTAPATPVPWRQMLRVAWMSIALGLLLELVLVLYAMSLGQADRPQPFIADLIQKVSWGFIVCLGVAFGVTASKAPEAKAGLLGLISAAVGFTVARSLHKAAGAALGVAGAVAGVSPFLIGGLKGLQKRRVRTPPYPPRSPISRSGWCRSSPCRSPCRSRSGCTPHRTMRRRTPRTCRSAPVRRAP